MSETPDPQQPKPAAIVTPARVTAPAPAAAPPPPTPAAPVRTDADAGEMWIQL